MKVRRQFRAGAVFAASAGVLLFCACATPQTAHEWADLKAQLADLNRRLTDTQVRLDELENRVPLLSSSSNAAPPADLRVVKLLPSGAKKDGAGLTLGDNSATNGTRRSSETSAERDLIAAREFARGKTCPEAAAAYVRFLAAHGEGPGASEAHFQVGLCEASAHRYDAALGQFLKVKNDPDRADEALYQQALCYAALGDVPKAKEILNDLATRLPDGPLAKRAREALERNAAAPAVAPPEPSNTP